jgi:hypothetical protein
VRGGAEGVGRGKQEADNTTRGGRGWMMQGKRVADNTTRGLLLRWQKWNPPMQVSADVDAIAHQLPSRREKEGRGPIIIEAGEKSTMTTRMLQA